MWRDQIANKRQKFANEIRRKQHEQYFQSKRMEHKENLEGIMYLPILLQNNAYDDILLILDTIETSPGAQGIDPKLARLIVQRYQHHEQLHVKLVMLKLMNRLGMWKSEHVSQGLQLLASGDESMLKQISYYLCIKLEKQPLNIQNGRQSGDPHTNVKQQIQNIFSVVMSTKLTNMDYRVFWIDIVCNAIQISPVCLQRCQQYPQLLLLLLEMSMQEDSNSVQLPRAISIMGKVASHPEFQRALVNFGSFPKFLNYIKNCDIEMVSTGLEIVSELLSADQAIIFKLVNQFNVISLLQRYIDHIFIPLQLKAIWGLSNVAASEQYHTLIEKEDLLAKIIRKACTQTRLVIRIQAYITIINLVCNCNSKQLEILANKYKIIEIQYGILEEISSEPAIKDKLLNITLYAVYHTLTDYPLSTILLEQLGAKKVLAKLYDNEKNQDTLKNISIVLDIIEKYDAQPKTSAT